MSEADWLALRPLFPALRGWTYLNTAAFGAIPTTATQAIQTHFADRNESAALDFLTWFDRLDSLREKVARLIGAQARDIGFCPNAGTALAWLLHGLDWRAGDEILGLDPDFPNNAYAPRMLEEAGVRCRTVRAEPGRFDVERFLSALSARTRLVLLSSVDYATGVRTPLEALEPELRRRGILLAVDGTQSVGVLRHDVAAVPCDFLIVSGYKWMLAPPGAGFFYAPSATRERLKPTLVSWRSDRRWRNVTSLHLGRPELPDEAAAYEGGVQPFALLFALEASLDLILQCGPERIERRALGLARECRELLAAAPGAELADTDERYDSAIVTAAFPGRDLADLSRKLKEEHVAVSVRRASLRVSCHFFNSRDDLRLLAAVLQR